MGDHEVMMHPYTVTIQHFAHSTLLKNHIVLPVFALGFELFFSKWQIKHVQLHKKVQITYIGLKNFHQFTVDS